ncbi:hypothetical protein DPSP01_001066 [Paraphaeosphaeria sporulosa]|uniref:Uncharacterized protein n=1 Tax=Paraphaeosphaeria sporulosa TaxID=1460663 RepID=A0A177C5A7_9PLEO|nr:uncharacterized protein CC84DRAFT_1262081 [Paraphaeosphaeria sporulosa]OAG02069.1 hypothetical protein CC84DRAFT_1262081 [Paraphaeosphaeria sporulosa]
MAAVHQASVSSMPGHKSPSEDNTLINHMTHLSGMTLADFVTEPKIHLVEASPSSSKQPVQSPSTMNLSSKRSSRASASTTKSQLRHTNAILVDMLQNIQNELAAHRTILLNIQDRVSTLEDESNATVNNDAPQLTLRALEGQDAPSKRNSRLLAPEVSSWWQACQTFASNAEPPMSAREFLKTPQRLSGFDFKWEVPNTPPITPPDVDDVPPLTPTSDEGEHSDLGSPLGQNVFLGEEITASTPMIAGPSNGADIDIMERTVEFDAKKLPAPPALQPAPSAKPTVVEQEDVVAAIEPEVVGNPQRYFKGVRSLATYKALLKHKPSEKEHHVLIHFHRRKDVDHLRAA